MDARTQQYRQARQDFFARYGALWPGTVADPYDILEPIALPRAEIALLLQSAACLAAIYQRTAPLLRTLSDEALLELGLPPATLKVVRCILPGVADTVVGRFDLARTLDGYKLLEFNADTPGLVVETFSVNHTVCQEAGKVDPNEGGEQILSEALRDAVRAGLKYVGTGEQQRANIVVTACGRYSRDAGIAGYLVKLLQQYDPMRTQYTPIEELSIDNNGLYDPQGKRIDVLLRVFPLQFFRNCLSWRGSSAQPIDTGAEADCEEGLFNLLKRRRLAVINPPSAFLLESKALQVVIWNLFEERMYFNSSERLLIEKYMLPTYLDPPSAREPYVVKPTLGAEGDSVALVNPALGSVRRALCTTYADQSMVYQRYVELPEMEVLTELGPQVLQMLTSCFVISGRPVGVCIRAGGAITDETAWVLPVCMAD
ncbi:MAG TPA: glutathionylspermidine synthase family protein [Candidatus Binatia bacterium]|nr:glutathionylspermidine synthase family protein [Candidatus Binatia bacterium]